MIGQLLDGRYQIVRTLGSGGFGQTFIAEDQRRPGHPVCVVKHLKPASSDPQFLETARRLFHSEAETLEQLGNQHDQIPRLLAFFEQDQEFYLVQEPIEGQTLSAELSPGQPWTETQVIGLLEEVLNILKFVHEQGVIHRDVKPDNIIRRRSDQKLFLVDFGAVKQVRTQMAIVQGQMSATIAVGTPGYMPSEQGQGKPRASSDIYALGIIGIQALTGINPAELQEDLETGEIIWQQEATVSAGLAAVLSKMVKCYFKERYISAAEALQALHQLRLGYTPTQSAPLVQPSEVQPSDRSGILATTVPVPQPLSQTTPVGGQPITQEQAVTNLQPRQTGVPKGVLIVGSLLAAAIFSLGIVLGLPRLSPQVITVNSDKSPEPAADSSASNQTASNQTASNHSPNQPGTVGTTRVASPRAAAVPTAPRTAPNKPAQSPQAAPPKSSDEPAQTPVAPPPLDQGAVTLDEAWMQADGGNYENAIAIAQTIPQSSAAYGEAQGLIESWQAAVSQPAPSQPIETAIECSAYASGSVSQLSDVSAADAYFQAVQAASALGVLGGCSDGTFRGNSPATQADYDAVQTALTQSGLDANCVYNYLSGGQTRYQLANTVVQVQQGCYVSNEATSDGEMGPI